MPSEFFTTRSIDLFSFSSLQATHILTGIFFSNVKFLKGEKIDIIPWSENPLEFIAKALSPAKVFVRELVHSDVAFGFVKFLKYNLLCSLRRVGERK